MTQYGTGHAWTWDSNAQMTITDANWTTYASSAAWTSTGLAHDTAAHQIKLVAAEQNKLAAMWEQHRNTALLNRLTTADFATAPHFGQMLVAMMGAMTGGHPGFLEVQPAFQDEDTTPDLARVGLFGVNVAQARRALGRPSLRRRELMNDPALCADAAIAYLKDTSATHSWDPLRCVAMMEKGRLTTVPGAQNVWQLDCRSQGSETWNNSLTKMAAFFAESQQFNRYRS